MTTRIGLSMTPAIELNISVALQEVAAKRRHELATGQAPSDYLVCPWNTTYRDIQMWMQRLAPAPFGCFEFLA
jgi:hypothetical protein